MDNRFSVAVLYPDRCSDFPGHHQPFEFFEPVEDDGIFSVR